MALLKNRGLSIEYRTEEAPLEALHAFDRPVEAGETVGIVGESGCGLISITHDISTVAEIEPR